MLISGGGTNLQAILDAEKAGALHSGSVKLVISNRKGAYGLERAKAAVRVLPIFDLIAKAGGVSERDMFNTFNMGVGMSITVAAADADKALAVLKAAGEDAYVIGRIVRSEGEKIVIC